MSIEQDFSKIPGPRVNPPPHVVNSVNSVRVATITYTRINGRRGAGFMQILNMIPVQINKPCGGELRKFDEFLGQFSTRGIFKIN